MGTVSYVSSQHRKTYIANDELSPAFFITNQLDCSLNHQAQTDIAEMLQARKGQDVQACLMEVVTEEGGTLTISVGVTGDVVAGFLYQADGNTAGLYYSNFTHTIGTTAANDILSDTDQLYGAGSGKFFTVDDTVDAVFNNAAATCLFRLTAWVLDWNIAATVAY
jgi:hypothetical protein